MTGRSTVYGVQQGSWDSELDMVGVVVTGNDLRVGGARSRDDEVRFTDCTNTFSCTAIVGYESGSTNVTMRQQGGRVTADIFLVGKPGTENCGASFRNVEWNVPQVYVGDAKDEARGRPERAWAEFHDMTFGLVRLVVGVQSVDSRMVVSNSIVNIDAVDHVNVGRSSGAAGNLPEIVDSTVTQSGAFSLYVGGNVGQVTNNVLRLVRSTYHVNTGGSSGDVIVGFRSGSIGNRLELVASTMTYDRKWFCVGQDGNGNAFALSDGSTLQIPAAGLSLLHYSILECSGAGNTIALGGDLSLTDGVRFFFRLSAQAALSPVLTINKKVVYGPNRPITVDVTGLDDGLYGLVSCTMALPDISDMPITVVGQTKNRIVKVKQSADLKDLFLQIATTGTIAIFR